MLVKRIDIHCHTISEPDLCRDDGQTFMTPQELFKVYDAIGVERSVLLPVVTPDGSYDGNTNREIQALVRQYPDRFSWFCNVDPRHGKNSPDTDFDRIVRHYKDRGAAGVGEIVANMPFDEPRVEALFAACQRLNMPILFHMGDFCNDYGLADRLGLPLLENALRKFPKLIFIGHSQKFWAEISGDLTEELRGKYPKGPVVPGGRLVELMERYPNLYADLSAGSGYNAVTRDLQFGCTFLERFQDRIFYGIDMSAPSDANRKMIGLGTLLDQWVTEGKLSQLAYEKVCRGNALRLLKGELVL